MKNTIIAPIVAVLCLLIELVSGQKVGTETQAEIVNAVVVVVSFGVTVWGIFKSHHKKG